MRFNAEARGYEMTCDGQLTATLDRTAEATVITLVGELDLAVEVEVDEVIQSAFSHDGTTSVHLDVTDVTFIGSAGVRNLLTARQASLDHGPTLSIRMRSIGPVARIVALCELGPCFDWQLRSANDDQLPID